MRTCAMCNKCVAGRNMYCEPCKQERYKKAKKYLPQGMRGAQRRDSTTKTVFEKLQRKIRLQEEGYEDPDDVCLGWLNG